MWLVVWPMSWTVAFALWVAFTVAPTPARTSRAQAPTADPLNPIDGMACKRCNTCANRYPTDRTAKECPNCGGELIWRATMAPDTEWPPEIPAVLPQLDSKVEAGIALEWRQIEEEARRRGPQWSVADVLEEWGGPRPV